MKYHKDMPRLIQEAMAELGFKISACQKIGISYAVLNTWENGELPTSYLEQFPPEEQEERKLEVFNAIKKGEKEFWAKMETVCVKRIAEDDSWQSKAWILERRLSETYAKKEKIDLDNKHSGKVNYNFNGLSLEELRELAKYSETENPGKE